MIHTVVSHSTFKPPHHCVGPQNIHLLRLHHLYHFLLFFFFNTTNRPLGRQCKSRNSVKLLRNAVVGFGNVIFSFCCSDLLPFYRVYVFSFLYLPPPVFFFCLYCLSFIRSATSPLWLKAFVKIWPPENGHREEMRASMKAALDGCLWGDTGALYKHSLLSHFLFWSSSWLDGRMLELRNIIINHYHGEFLNSGSWGHPNNNNLEGLWVSNPRKKNHEANQV